MKGQSLLRLFAVISAFGALFAAPKVNAQSWTTVGSAGFMPLGNTWDHVFFDASNTLYVSFSNAYGQVMRYDDTGWASVGSADITPGTASDSWSAIAPNGNIYFSYADGSNSSKAAVMMYDGSSWSSLGNNISANAATYTNIIVASDGTPYISYLDNTTTPSSLYVKKYDGSSWSMVGSAAVTTAGASYPSMAIDDNDNLYIAYQDDSNVNQNITVRKFDGTDWVALGAPFSAQALGGAFFIAMKIDHNSTPYVAYMSPYPNPNAPSICVSKYDGTNWVTVGNASFTGSAIFTSLAIDHNNVPYVAYVDNANAAAASVMKFDGTAWSNVGTPGLSSGSTVYTTIAIDANNNPYIAYLDGTNGGTTVMKYTVCTPSSAATVNASDTFICAGNAVTLNATGTLNDATNWYWYTGSCSGTLVDSGASITLTPGDTTTYYVHGYGGCVLFSACSNITVYVDSVSQPNITVSGVTLTSSATSGNQWYKNDTAISGATAQTYTVSSSGWYKVSVTNANNCSAMSDSVFIIGEGVPQISSDPNIHVYPSPTTDNVHIDFGTNKYDLDNSSISMADCMGRTVVFKNGLKKQNIISLRDLPSGVYIINLITNQTKQVMKIIKQ